jgi:alpha-ribazole phosphatase
MVRHAPVEARGLCYGQFNVATTMDASEAAEAVERAFHAASAVAVEELWCSPWERTRNVAMRLAERARVPLQVDPRLSEVSFGEWEGLSFDEIDRRDGERFTRWMADYDGTAPPGGESANELVARVAAWLEQVRSSGRTVLAVTHAGPIRAARAVRAGVRYSAVVSGPVPFLVPEAL